MYKILILLAFSASTVTARATWAYFYTEEGCPQWGSEGTANTMDQTNDDKVKWSEQADMRKFGRCWKDEVDNQGIKNGHRRRALLIPDKKHPKDPDHGCLKTWLKTDCTGDSFSQMKYSLSPDGSLCYDFDGSSDEEVGYGSYQFLEECDSTESTIMESFPIQQAKYNT